MDRREERARLGLAVRRRREVLGMTRNGLGQRAGVSRPHVVAIELGETLVGMEILARVAAALQTSVDGLLREAGLDVPVAESGELSELWEQLRDQERRVVLQVMDSMISIREDG